LLEHRAGIQGEGIPLVLLGFGVGGAITNFLAGVTVRRFLRATFVGRLSRRLHDREEHEAKEPVRRGSEFQVLVSGEVRNPAPSALLAPQ
jgi:hypothetical protein